MDLTCALTLSLPGTHHLGVIVDGLASFVVDGVICDGGFNQLRGWAWLHGGVGNLQGEMAHVLGGRLWGRALLVSELVGNFRVGPNATAVTSSMREQLLVVCEHAS